MCSTPILAIALRTARAKPQRCWKVDNGKKEAELHNLHSSSYHSSYTGASPCPCPQGSVMLALLPASADVRALSPALRTICIIQSAEACAQVQWGRQKCIEDRCARSKSCSTDNVQRIARAETCRGSAHNEKTHRIPRA